MPLRQKTVRGASALFCTLPFSFSKLMCPFLDISLHNVRNAYVQSGTKREKQHEMGEDSIKKVLPSHVKKA